jgi:hypothetical protein
MTPTDVSPAARPPDPDRVSLDDVRHKALAVRDMAADEARQLMEERAVRVVIAGVVVIAVALSVTYWLGTRAAERAVVGVRR